MRLQTRIILLMIGFFLLFQLLGFVMLRLTLGPVQLTAEEEIAKLNLTRVASALHRESEHLSVLLGDWARWDEAYRFVQDRNLKFQVTNLSPDTFRKTRLDVLIIVNSEGETVWSNLFDQRTGAGMKLPELPARKWPKDHPLLSFSDLKQVHAGILTTGSGPLQIAAAPILTSMGTGPRQGTLIIGRFLDQEEIARLNEQTKVSFSLAMASNQDLPPDDLKLENYLDDFQLLPEAQELMENPDFGHILARDASLSRPEFYRHPQNPNLLRIFAYYPDIYGRPGLLLEVNFPRILSHLSKRLALIVFSCLALVGALFTLAHLAIIRRLITKPIARLQNHITEMHAGENLSDRVNLEGRDEIGELGREYNRMLERLEIDRRKLKRTEAELRLSEKKFKELSIRDDLTGLYNTRYFYQGLQHHFENCTLTQKPLALIFIDIDRFKQVVDTHGHVLGSRAIREVGQTIQACLTRPAFAVAYGGDEYVVVLPGMDRAAAMDKANEIRQTMVQTAYLSSHGVCVRLTASFGVASYPENARTLEELLAIADSSLFYVKSIGRNGVA